jgi:hypothetical protein
MVIWIFVLVREKADTVIITGYQACPVKRLVWVTMYLQLPAYFNETWLVEKGRIGWTSNVKNIGVMHFVSLLQKIKPQGNIPRCDPAAYTVLFKYGTDCVSSGFVNTGVAYKNIMCHI